MSTKNNGTKDKLLDHNYDGIQELDNPLPRWWVWLFYLTTIFGIFYFVYFTFGFGNSIEETFVSDMEKIEELKAEKSGQAIVFTDSKEIRSKGQTIFESKCAPCHGKLGEGIVGPNLTDKYWIKGKGKNKDIYDIIEKGIPENGMIAWESLLSKDDIVALTMFIQAIQGTNPPKALPPKGTYVE